MKERGYQHDFSDAHAEMYSGTDRSHKALTMRLVLQEAFGPALARSRVLDVGCSTGLIDTALAPWVGTIEGIDIDVRAVEFAQRHAPANATFRVGDAMAIDAFDATYDIVLCSQVYEHVPDPAQLMREIGRVLRPGGACFFAATNRLNPMEQHYKLPLLSVIPVPLAHRYLRILRRGDYYYERHMTYWQLLRLTAAFSREDFTPRILRDPDRYGAGYMFPGVILTLARAVRRLAYWAFPGYVWLLWKPRPP